MKSNYICVVIMPPNYKRYVECMLTIVQLLRKRDKHIIFRTLKYFLEQKRYDISPYRNAMNPQITERNNFAIPVSWLPQNLSSTLQSPDRSTLLLFTILHNMIHIYTQTGHFMSAFIKNSREIRESRLFFI